MLTNKNHTVLYTGVTSDLTRRMWQHKNKQIDGFAKKYSCNKLVWFQSSDDISSAIEREKQIKAGSRKKKENLIDEMNPEWNDLSDSL